MRSWRPRRNFIQLESWFTEVGHDLAGKWPAPADRFRPNRSQLPLPKLLLIRTAVACRPKRGLPKAGL
jgi:hypothetical protein